MTTNTRNVFGAFADPIEADQAIKDLENAGVEHDQIHSSRQSQKGGFLAGLKSMFTGEDATANTNAQDLTGMDVSEDEARYYNQEEQAGHVVVAVQTSGHEQDIAHILQAHGATCYATQRERSTGRGARPSSSTQQSSAATTGMNPTDVPTGRGRVDAGTGRAPADMTAEMKSANMRAPGNQNAPRTEDSNAMKLRAEQLDVTKQRAQTGEVTLRKDVVAEEKTINVPVSHEEVYIERHPVTDARVDDATPLGEGESIRIPVSEERVNVNKDTVVTGEVSINKRTVEETQQVTDTVRREEARVEQQGKTPLRDRQQQEPRSPDAPDKK